MHKFLAGILYDIISLEFFRVKVLFNLSVPCTVITSENFKFARATQGSWKQLHDLSCDPAETGDLAKINKQTSSLF